MSRRLIILKLDDLDLGLVDAVVRDHRPIQVMTHDERDMIIFKLWLRGLTDNEIAEHMAVSVRLVERYRGRGDPSLRIVGMGLPINPQWDRHHVHAILVRPSNPWQLRHHTGGRLGTAPFVTVDHDPHEGGFHDGRWWLR